MYCIHCGAEIPEDSKHCPFCGEALEVPEPADDDTTDSIGPIDAPYAQSESYEPPIPLSPSAPAEVAVAGGAAAQASVMSPGRRRRRAFMLYGIIAAVIIVAGIAAYLFIQDRNAKQAAWEAAHAPVPVAVAISADGFGGDDSTPAYLHLTGTDLDGNKVDETVSVQSASATVEMLRGEYDLTAAADIATTSGTLLTAPKDTHHIVVSEEGVAVGSSGSEAAFAYTAVAPESVTDAQIQGLYDALIANGIDVSVADGYRDSIANARKSKLDAIAAEKAAREAQEREAAEEEARAAYHVTTSQYEFDLPAYWRGKVEYANDKTADGYERTTVYLKGHPKLVLLTVFGTSSKNPLNGGDIETHLAFHAESGSVRVEGWSRNWPWMAVAGKHGSIGTYSLKADQIKELVDISSGGYMSYDDAKKLGEDGVGVPDVDYLTSTVKTTLKVL